MIHGDTTEALTNRTRVLNGCLQAGIPLSARLYHTVRWRGGSCRLPVAFSDAMTRTVPLRRWLRDRYRSNAR